MASRSDVRVKRKISCQEYIISMMSGHGPNQFSLLKKNIKVGRPEHSLTPYPLRPITSHVCLTPLSPSKWMSYVYHPLLLLLIIRM